MTVHDAFLEQLAQDELGLDLRYPSDHTLSTDQIKALVRRAYQDGEGEGHQRGHEDNVEAETWKKMVGIIQASNDGSEGLSNDQIAREAQAKWRDTRKLDPYRNEGTVQEKVALLIKCFPVMNLKPIPWTDPFVPSQLDAWAASDGGQEILGRAAQNVIRFILNIVWSDVGEWQMGPFVFRTAWGSWDSHQRQAFRVWLEDPWFA